MKPEQWEQLKKEIGGEWEIVAPKVEQVASRPEQHLYEAILRVIDDGCRRHGGKNYVLWGGDDETLINAERMDFANLIIETWNRFKREQ